MSATPGEITELLQDWSEGDPDALERLMPLVIEDLRQIASVYFRHERHDHTLQPTALVNEMYLRLVGRRSVNWRNRAHFFGFAAQVMRMMLVDHARRRQTEKRGSGTVKLDLKDLDIVVEPDLDLLALDDALAALAKVDPRALRVVELRFFAGLSVEEIAAALNISTTTVKREWRAARFFLMQEMGR